MDVMTPQAPQTPGVAQAAPPQMAGASMTLPQRTHDVVVKRSKTVSQCKIEPVPPEEFGIARNARSIRDADYAFHKVISTQGKLLAQGYDAKQVEALSTYTGITNAEETSRDTVWESQVSGEKQNRSARRIEVTEHYIRMDYEGDGNACLYKVTTGGTQGDILIKDGKEDIEPIDEIPFAGITPIPQPHRFYGRSVADLVMDIQRVKTALMRGMLDNVYLVNNPRVEVAESMAGPQTLDDLLVARPGGIVRTKLPGGITWQQVPNIAAATFPALEYMDAVREWRSGVTRQGQGIDADALVNQTATAVNQTFNAAQAKVKLIARIFAETGIKDLFSLVHGMIRKHGQEEQTTRLRNKWVKIDPRDWKKRNDLTIHVGLGGGSKMEQAAGMMSIMSIQEKIVMSGGTNVVGASQIHAAATAYTKLIGHKNGDAFFKDPDEKGPDGQLVNPPPPPKPDPKLVELQAKNEIEKTQAQADIATQNMKTQAEAALAERKFQLESAYMEREFQLKEREHQMNMAMMATKSASQPKQTVKDADGNESVVDDGGGNAMAPMLAMLMEHMQKANAPKRIVRDEHGRVSHVEPMG